MSVNKPEYLDTVVLLHKCLSFQVKKRQRHFHVKKKGGGVNLTNHAVSFRSQHKVSFSAWTAAVGLWHISLTLPLSAKLGPTAWKPIPELPLGALLYHLILIYPPLPINLEHVILPGQRSVIFWKRLLMASILLSSGRVWLTRVSLLQPVADSFLCFTLMIV